MIKIGINLLSAVVVFVVLRDVGGQLLNDGRADEQFPSMPNQPSTLGSSDIICPPCVLDECDSTTGINHRIASLNGTEAERIFGLNNVTSDGIYGKECPNDGVPVLDDCGCCTICVKRANETCGGIAKRLGTCQPGSTCWPVSPAKGVLLNGSEIGVCIGKHAFTFLLCDEAELGLSYCYIVDG